MPPVQGRSVSPGWDVLGSDSPPNGILPLLTINGSEQSSSSASMEVAASDEGVADDHEREDDDESLQNELMDNLTEYGSSATDYEADEDESDEWEDVWSPPLSPTGEETDFDYTASEMEGLSSVRRRRTSSLRRLPAEAMLRQESDGFAFPDPLAGELLQRSESSNASIQPFATQVPEVVAEIAGFGNVSNDDKYGLILPAAIEDTVPIVSEDIFPGRPEGEWEAVRTPTPELAPAPEPALVPTSEVLEPEPNVPSPSSACDLVVASAEPSFAAETSELQEEPVMVPSPVSDSVEVPAELGPSSDDLDLERTMTPGSSKNAALPVVEDHLEVPTDDGPAVDDGPLPVVASGLRSLLGARLSKVDLSSYTVRLPKMMRISNESLLFFVGPASLILAAVLFMYITTPSVTTPSGPQASITAVGFPCMVAISQQPQIQQPESHLCGGPTVEPLPGREQLLTIDAPSAVLSIDGTRNRPTTDVGQGIVTALALVSTEPASSGNKVEPAAQLSFAQSTVSKSAPPHGAEPTPGPSSDKGSEVIVASEDITVVTDSDVYTIAAGKRALASLGAKLWKNHRKVVKNARKIRKAAVAKLTKPPPSAEEGTKTTQPPRSANEVVQHLLFHGALAVVV